MQGDQVRTRALVSQRKTDAPVQFETTEQARAAVARWVNGKTLTSSDWLFPSRVDRTKPMTTRQYGRLVGHWIAEIGLSPAAYGTHSLRRTKAALIYRKTGNMRACSCCLNAPSWTAPCATSVLSGGCPYHRRGYRCLAGSRREGRRISSTIRGKPPPLKSVVGKRRCRVRSWDGSARTAVASVADEIVTFARGAIVTAYAPYYVQ